MSIYDNVAYGPRIHGIKSKAKLDEIAKFSQYTIRPMLLGTDGSLTEQVVAAPVVKKRFR